MEIAGNVEADAEITLRLFNCQVGRKIEEKQFRTTNISTTSRRNTHPFRKSLKNGYATWFGPSQATITA